MPLARSSLLLLLLIPCNLHAASLLLIRISAAAKLLARMVACTGIPPKHRRLNLLPPRVGRCACRGACRCDRAVGGKRRRQGTRVLAGAQQQRQSGRQHVRA